jgi:3-oxoadipyl-CoA thiolase
MGCANQAGEDNRNVARMALLLAGLPHTVPGETVNRLCASGMSAVVQAARALHCGDAGLVIAGGVEHMTRGPYVVSKTSRPFGNDARMYDSSFGWRFINPRMEARYGVEAMGETAENLADMFGISREDQDRFALASQRKASAARESGRLAQEILPVEVHAGKGGGTLFTHDEFIKPHTSAEGLAALRPAFRKSGGTVTAGNASGLNDGAAALLLASEDMAGKYGLTPLARIRSSAVTGCEPRIMGIGPVEATRRALSKAGLSLDDIDLIELNEAFAAQSLACIRQLGLADDDPRLNVNGGAIALGHPLGMSGARLLLTAALELRQRGLRRALATMCVGVGQGYAVVLEAV